MFIGLISIIALLLVTFHFIMYFTVRAAKKKEAKVLTSILQSYEDVEWRDFYSIMQWRKSSGLTSKEVEKKLMKTGAFPYWEQVHIIDIIPTDDIGTKFLVYLKDQPEYNNITSYTPL